jgi:hypothetical protein
MKIVQKTAVSQDSRSGLVIEIGDEEMSFFDGEPEDSALYRNFSDCYEIVRFLKMAWESGKKGEEFEVVREDVDWDEL